MATHFQDSGPLGAHGAARTDATERTIEQEFELRYRYPVVFARHVFDPDSPILRDVFNRAGEGPHRVLPVIDSGVLEADPELPTRLQQYAAAHADRIELIAAPLVVRGGERSKHDPREIQEFYERVERHQICRHSFVLAIGGGSVLDAIGFAAATAHRGLRLIRMPTTVLAQNDAGIGVKNAVNFNGRKNFIGTFAPPFAVVNDFALLATLPKSDCRSGIAEAVKIALIKDANFFEYLYDNRMPLSAFVPEPLEQMIVRCAELHLAHIRDSGDPFEAGSARPLDFGHWSAHQLEELSRSKLRHGEAVAIGVALDSVYSARLGMLESHELDRILSLLEDLGFDLQHRALRELDIPVALSNFREHLGGQLCVTMLDRIGRGVEMHEVDATVMAKSVDFLLNDR
jgi:3-dehydroquinate synthase